MHPAARVVLYLITALVIPGLNFFGLGVLLGLALAGATRRLKPVGRLLWRTRWLFLLVLLGAAFSLPGEAALAWLGDYSPTREGLLSGAEHTLRLLVILLLLDTLVLAMPREPQLAGLYLLMQPFRHVGLAPEMAAVRLGLTLDYMEQPKEHRLSLRQLMSDDLPIRETPDHYLLPVPPWQPRDTALLVSAIALVLMLWQLA